MRELLFRGRKFDYSWVYGWYCRYPFSGRFPLKDAIIPAEDAEDGYYHHVQVDGSTVGQFAGICDKNGNRIFKGDIVSHSAYNSPLVVKWDGCGFELWLEETYIDRLDKYSATNCTVIGNIHDNPELIEGGGEDG